MLGSPAVFPSRRREKISRSRSRCRNRPDDIARSIALPVADGFLCADTAPRRKHARRMCQSRARKQESGIRFWKACNLRDDKLRHVGAAHLGNDVVRKMMQPAAVSAPAPVSIARAMKTRRCGEGGVCSKSLPNRPQRVGAMQSGT